MAAIDVSWQQRIVITATAITHVASGFAGAQPNL